MTPVSFALKLIFTMKLLTIYMLLLAVFSTSFMFTMPSYDYYKFAEQWPKTYCKNQVRSCHIPIPTTFTIHGLWPSNNSGPQPSNCQGATQLVLSSQLPPAVQLQLAGDWPNLNGNDFTFWKHEWDEHGSCSTLSQQPIAYFSLAMTIKGRRNLTAVLEAAGIVPRLTAPYDINLIINTIKTSTGMFPELQCKRDPRRPFYSDLAEIRLCLDVNGASYINCSTPYYLPTCTRNIYLPV